MRSFLVPALVWGFWANIVYIVGMIGYLIIDTSSYMFISLNSTFSFIVYLILTIVFVIDAYLYTIDWYIYAVQRRKNKNEPIQYRAEFIACIFQILGSYFYLIGAILAYDRFRFMKKILLFNLIGIIAFLIEAGFTLLGWRIMFKIKPSTDPKRGCVIQVTQIQ